MSVIEGKLLEVCQDKGTVKMYEAGNFFIAVIKAPTFQQEIDLEDEIKALFPHNVKGVIGNRIVISKLVKL